MGGEQSHGLSSQDTDYLRKNTKFSHEEIQEWHETFNRDFPNGVITKPDFIVMYTKMFPKGKADQFAEHVFRAYDTDGNGEIDFHEFMCTLSVATKGSVEEKLKWAFRMYDVDGNGYVSRKEAIDMITSIYRMKGIPQAREKAEDMALQIFLRLDRDQDDSLSEVEFIIGAKNTPSLRDILSGGQ